MQQREKYLAIIFAATVGLGVVVPKVWDIFSGPISQRQKTLNSLTNQRDSKDGKLILSFAQLKKMKAYKEQSLSPKPAQATLEYQQWLTDLGEIVAGFSNLKVTPERNSSSRGETYSAIRVSLSGSGTLDQLKTFLFRFNQVNLLHRIQRLNLDSEGQQGNSRISFSLTAEALALTAANKRGENLFQRTQLAAAVTADAKSLEVEKSLESPEELGSVVRIGQEYFTVTNFGKRQWKIQQRSANQNHPAETIVELLLLHPETESRTLADYAVLQELNPFAKPQTYSPRLEISGSKTFNRGESLTLQAKVSNKAPKHGVPTFSLVNQADLPDGFSFDKKSGQLTWKPTADAQAGDVKIRWQASLPGLEKPLSTEVTVSLLDPNHAPVLETIGAKSAVLGQELVIQLKATDEDQPDETLTFRIAKGAPEGAELDAITGMFRWTPAATISPGEFEVTFEVADSGEPAMTSSEVVKLNLADDVARFTYLTAAVSVDERRQAWLFDRSTNEKIILQEGSLLNYGGINGLVLAIGRDSITLQTDIATYRLDLGKNLRQLQELPNSRTIAVPTKADSPVVAPKPIQ